MAADWAQLVQSGLIRQAQVMGFNNLGLWMQAVDDTGRLRLYVLTDINSTIPGATFKTVAGIAGDSALVIRFAGPQTVTIGGIPAVTLSGSSNVVTFAAGAQVRTGTGNGASLGIGGSVTAPGLGANISGSITLGSGTNYNVWCVAGISFGVPVAADEGNMVFTNVPSAGGPIQLSYGVNAMGFHGPFWVAGTGQAIHVDENLGGATAGVRYSASIWAVPVP